MNEFILINVPPTEPPTLPEEQATTAQEQIVLREENNNCNWTTNKTKIFIELYQKYRKKVGTMEIRTQDKLFSVIATELNKILSTSFSANHCKNKWRVLERA